jgi:butyrate kinase
MIADAIAGPLGIPAFIYDAVSADELAPVAKITGIPEITRQSFGHVLNSKAVARMAAKKQNTVYEKANFIVAHIGGGISVTAHNNGRIVDVITDDAGPFSPERAGSVPLGYIIDICYSGRYTKAQLTDKLKKNSGVKGHLGTNDGLEIERRIAQGDSLAAAVYEAQAYQIAQGIGQMAPPLCGRVNAVILTGGLAHSSYIVGEITRRVAYLAPVEVYAGEYEMEALALGALRMLKGEETPHVYRAAQ